jgi:hypothetical protein
MTPTARPLALALLLLAGCGGQNAQPPATASAFAASSASEAPEPSGSAPGDDGVTGQIAYVAGADPQIHLLDLATGESRQLTNLGPEHAELADAGPFRPVLTCGFGPGTLAWSPDGSMLAFSYGGCEAVLYVVDLDGELTRIADGRSPAWSPDGARLVFSPMTPFCFGGPECGQAPEPGAWNLHVIDLVAGGAPRPLTLHEAAQMAGQPTYSPDGSLIAFTTPLTGEPAEGGAFGATQVISADGGEPRVVARGAWPAGWLPDGRLLIVAEETSDVIAIDLETGESAALGRDGGRGVVAPDGTRLLLTALEPGSDTVHVRMTTVEGDVLVEGPGFPAGWAPDSSAAIVVDHATSEIIVVDREGEELGRYEVAAGQQGLGEAAWRPGS